MALGQCRGFAGLTVIIALAALNVTASVPGLMGTVVAFCVLIAVLIARSLTRPCSA